MKLAHTNDAENSAGCRRDETLDMPHEENSDANIEFVNREAADVERLRTIDELEMRVRQRTADLRTANDFLREQIEERKRLFERVETAKRIWEGTFDAIEQGVIVCDAGGRVARCNRYAADMVDTHAAVLIGLSREQVFAKLFGAHAAPRVLMQTAGTPSVFELNCEDGRRYLMSVAALPPFDMTPHTSEAEPDAAWQVFTWSDITTLAEVQEQLQRSRRLAVVGGLAAGVAHEINNPLAAITTCAEAIRRDLRRAAGDENSPPTIVSDENDNPVARAARDGDWVFYLEEIVRQSLRCKAITGGLLDLARERRARFEFVDANEVVESCVRVFAPGVGAGVRLTADLDPRLGRLLTDEGMLRQILDNLVGNALHAVADRAATHDGEVCLATHAGDEARVIIEVSDNGAGIAPENLARIFDPFWTTRHAGHGAGLGLAVCQTLAEILGGSINVESKPGVGSRFRLWLPRR